MSVLLKGSLNSPIFSRLSCSISQLFSRSNSSMLGLAGTGNPYETKVRLRREVKDLSMPDFKNVECLKWANARMTRDVKRRILCSKYWQYRLNLHNLAYSRTLPSVIRDVALEERNSCPRDSSINHIRNRCSLTSRTRGKYPLYRISRMVWRDLADHGLISGAKRAQWG